MAIRPIPRHGPIGVGPVLGRPDHRAVPGLPHRYVGPVGQARHTRNREARWTTRAFGPARHGPTADGPCLDGGGAHGLTQLGT
uniref:Uncharacterized protein n=1 Tax=Oryza glumipatula TaxID=40148 RepID=A0A0E0B7C1_9ORYZ